MASNAGGIVYDSSESESESESKFLQSKSFNISRNFHKLSVAMLSFQITMIGNGKFEPLTL